MTWRCSPFPDSPVAGRKRWRASARTASGSSWSMNRGFTRSSNTNLARTPRCRGRPAPIWWRPSWRGSRQFPGTLRVHIVAPDSVRIGNLMLDRRLERTAVRQLLRELDAGQRAQYKNMSGRATALPHWFDLILNAESMDSEQMVEMIQGSVRALGLKERGFLSAAAQAQIQFQIRLRLARHGIVPPGVVRLPGKNFAHQSEQIFANLLDFYRIAWEYEPRNFPVQWDAEGRISESFTPDFYLPEFDQIGRASC